jgi:hypothetical protein
MAALFKRIKQRTAIATIKNASVARNCSARITHVPVMVSPTASQPGSRTTT